MTSTLRHYLARLNQNLASGAATEHTHRPALKALLEALDLGITATNEPKRIACGAPDYVVTRGDLVVGYIEAKDIGVPLDQAERSEQLKRYLRSLGNFILTDYLEFRRYVDGEQRGRARLARPDQRGQLKTERGGAEAVLALLTDYLTHHPQPVGRPAELATRLARLAHMIRDTIVSAYEQEQASTLLRGWREAFARVLIADLDRPEKTAEFADMFAQTLAYGLFTARIMDPTPQTFSRQEAQRLIPKSNPFLRDFFYQITGPQMEDEPFAPFVDDLVNLLANSDMAAILADFGRRTRQEDPVVHFYETFLAAYDPRLREARGVYYTPEPVVSYIVRSVDHLLKTRFDCPQGLADSSTITIPNYDPGQAVKGKRTPRKTTGSHKVLILDPATGTGTFLYAVIDHIREQFIQGGNAGMWPGYVKNHLLPRLFGFELLMAPYAVAHFKLSLQLAGRDLPGPLGEQWAYIPEEGERLGIYLTNALEEAHEMTGLPLFTQWVADETNAANEVKQHLPIMVVMGNPPYSGHSANQGEWITNLLRGRLPDGSKTSSYYEIDGKPLGESNTKWLQDDYVKFIRFAQWRIQRTGSGILAFISNNGYLDNPTFRGMRQQLMQNFTDIYILNLHGSVKKRESTPDGAPDENVFDIQQGVAIGLFIKEGDKKSPAKVHHADLWGSRENKYEQLFELDVQTAQWELLSPEPPFYLFIPQDIGLRTEYTKGWKITEIMSEFSLGCLTKRDKLVIGLSRKEVREHISQFLDPNKTASEAASEFGLRLRDKDMWDALTARKSVQIEEIDTYIRQESFRPFDTRYIFYHDKFVARLNRRVMQHLDQRNLAFVTVRQLASLPFDHIWITNALSDQHLISVRTKEGGVVFPLYLYPSDETTTRQKKLLDTAPWPPGQNGRVPNLNPDFIADLEARLSLAFSPDGAGDLATTFGPEDIFSYIYAIFHSPAYRERYAEFLKIDFPRLPLTSEVGLFRALCGLGRELVALHLLESPAVNQFSTRYPAPGDNRVERGYPRYVSPGESQAGRVMINPSQYVEGVPPEVWEFYIGGYQVCDKWLKDRRGRQLSYDDLTHYQRVVVALKETIRLMDEIDRAIPEWPIT